MMFCPSRLLDARNPQVYKRQTGFVTYQYHVYNKDNRWLVDKPQLLRISQVNGVYPLWSCLTINRPTGELYFGHDRPIVATPPDGLNSVFTDGSAAWTEWDDCENYFLDVSVQFYVWPKAVR
jgi:hypothetical protein